MIYADEDTRYLVTFLMIMVYRLGGSIEIDNLSEFANRNIELKMELKVESDKVVLTTSEET